LHRGSMVEMVVDLLFKEEVVAGNKGGEEIS
jgi:hypothetical protein